MFTGLVSDVGRVLSIEDRRELKRIRIEMAYVMTAARTRSQAEKPT